MRIRLAVVLVLMGIAAAWISWIMGTAGGARFALDLVSRAIPAKVEIGRVQGRLWNRLYIARADIRWNEGDARIEGLTIRWKPWMIILRSIAVNELSASKIEITARKAEKEPVRFEWPQAPWYLSWLRGWVKDLRVGMASYSEGKEQPYSVRDFAAALDWRFGILQAEKIKCALQGGDIAGNIQAGFTQPFLKGRLIFNPSGSSGRLRQVELKLKLGRGEKEGMAGPVEVRLSIAPERTFHLTGRLGLLHSRLHLSHTSIREEGRKGTVEADGSLDLAEPYKGRLSLGFAGLDLSRELTPLADVSGRFIMESNLSAYGGQFELTNKTPGLAQGVLGGTCKGSSGELSVKIDRGTFLQGSVTGSVSVVQQEDTKISASLAARGLNPGIAAKEWHGSVNADLEGSVILAGGRPPEIEVKAALGKSVIRNKPLEGVIDASWRRNRLKVTRLDLHGQGFDLSAHGLLDERIDYTADVRSLGLFAPGAHGSVHAAGWARWKDGKAAGTTKVLGRDISFHEFRAASIKADIDADAGGSVNGSAYAKNVDYGSLRFSTVSALLEGKMEEHALKAEAKWRGGKAELALAGSYDKRRWDGQIRTLKAQGLSLDRPAALSISRKALALGPLQVSGDKGEKINMEAHLTPEKLEGFISAEWDRIDLARLNAILSDHRKLSGSASGRLKAEWRDGHISNVAGAVRAAGGVSAKGFNVETSALDATIRWDRKGLAASLEGRLSPSGRVKGMFSSGEGVQLGLPRSADFSLLWERLDIKMVRSFLPRAIAAEGLLSGSVKGRILRDGAVDATGETHISKGLLACRTEHGIISAQLSTAKAHLIWRESALSGDLDFVLADHGRVQGTFLIPLRSHPPFSLNRAGPVKLSLSGSMREKGLLTAFLPGLVRESHGRLHLNASASGTWERPGLEGSLKLSDAGAFLPAAGISLREAAAQVDFTEKQATITSLLVRSGDGMVEGKGIVLLSGLKPVEFNVSLTGKEFQAVYLPELRARISPDLQIKGTPEKVLLRGSISIPEASLVRQDTGVVRASPDVRIVDRPVETQKPLPFEFDARIDIVLGAKVTVAAEGINASLGGKVTLTGTSMDDMRAKGEVDITKGYYSTYGVRLDIERGKIRFAGGPVESGRLDILALRKISETKTGEIKPTEIKAGVLVTGPVRSPVINLYSNPNMADTDILSYIVLGGPLEQNASQTGLLLKAAEALLPQGQSSSLKTRLQNYLGIDTLAVESKPGQGGTTQSILTVGKYLTPRLYVGMGRALLSDESLITMKMALSKRWELLSQTGTQSGIGLYYKVEFD